MSPTLYAIVIALPVVAMFAQQSAAFRGPPVTVTFELKTNLIVLDARINNSSRRLILDTGASQTMLDTASIRDLHIDASDRRTARGAGGDIEVSLAPLKSVTVGDARVENLTCIVSDVSALAEKLGGNIDGVLGYDFLSKFRLTIDYAARKLTLEPYAAAPAAAPRIEGHTFTHSASGLTVTRPNADWEFVTETKYPQIIVILQRRNDSATTAEFQVQELHGLTLEQLWPDLRESLKKQYEDYSELSTTPRKLGNVEARQLDFTGRERNKPVRVRLLAFIDNGRLWTVTCTAAPGAFPAVDADFQKTLGNFAVSEPR